MATLSTYRSEEILWRLANATVCDAQEVASELPIVWDRLTGAVFSAASAWPMRSDLKRLAGRQEKLVDRLKASGMQAWPHDACGKMAVLLEELLHDERAMFQAAANSPTLVNFLWQQPMEMLRTQAVELESICRRLDALSVTETHLPGDQDFADFVSLLRGADNEVDFSTDDEYRKERSVQIA